MKTNYSIPSYACDFRINYGNGQCTAGYGSFEVCQHFFDLWNLADSFIQFKDVDSREWFTL